jgi:hypothetical protein
MGYVRVLVSPFALEKPSFPSGAVTVFLTLLWICLEYG